MKNKLQELQDIIRDNRKYYKPYLSTYVHPNKKEFHLMIIPYDVTLDNFNSLKIILIKGQPF
jgi:hypothetical protein